MSARLYSVLPGNRRTSAEEAERSADLLFQSVLAAVASKNFRHWCFRGLADAWGAFFDVQAGALGVGWVLVWAVRQVLAELVRDDVVSDPVSGFSGRIRPAEVYIGYT